MSETQKPAGGVAQPRRPIIIGRELLDLLVAGKVVAEGTRWARIDLAVPDMLAKVSPAARACRPPVDGRPLGKALHAAGVLPERTRRVTIELPIDDVVVLYCDVIGDERLLEVDFAGLIGEGVT